MVTAMASSTIVRRSMPGSPRTRCVRGAGICARSHPAGDLPRATSHSPKWTRPPCGRGYWSEHFAGGAPVSHLTRPSDPTNAADAVAASEPADAPRRRASRSARAGHPAPGRLAFPAPAPASTAPMSALDGVALVTLERPEALQRVELRPPGRAGRHARAARRRPHLPGDRNHRLRDPGVSRPAPISVSSHRRPAPRSRPRVGRGLGPDRRRSACR